MRKDTPRDNLPRPGPKIRAALVKLQTKQGQRWLENKTSEYLAVLQQGLTDMAFYPGATEDRLFKSTYQHKHHTPLECAICASDDEDGVCNAAVGLSCEQIKCDAFNGSWYLASGCLGHLIRSFISGLLRPETP